VTPNTDGRLRIRSRLTAQPADGTPLSEDGWFVPGDIGHLDENGRLFITGRTTDLINVGGAKIAPERVEQVLSEHPGVADCGVVGVPDPSGGDLIVAAVVARGELNLDELSGFVAERFRAAPVARIIRLDRIPRGATGKIVRPMLAQILKE
jgi:long-chain acyl-CoA synthetase